MSAKDLKKLERIKELIGSGAKPDPRLELFGDMLERRIAFKDRLILEPLPRAAIEIALKQGTPAIGGSEAHRAASSDFQAYGREIEKVLKGRGLLNGETIDLKALLDACREGRADEEEFAVQFGDASKICLLLLTEVVRPLYEKLHESLEDICREARWTRARCYICGGKADLAYISGQEGRRTLCCTLCGTSWHYPRLKCPYCETEEQQKLVRLEIDGENLYSVDACNACRTYVKVIDWRGRVDDIYPDVEDVLSVHMDLIAQREGFRAP